MKHGLAALVLLACACGSKALVAVPGLLTAHVRVSGLVPNE